jgi:hypothetical protein
MKTFLFLTSTNLAVNPRLTKELQLATEHGFSCCVIQFRLGNWSDSITSEIEKKFPKVDFHSISATRHPFFMWLFSTILERILKYIPLNILSDRFLAYSISKRSILLMLMLNNLKVKFDWVIAHNPATFYPALVFSNKISAKLGIDIEDYHPGETNNDRQISRMKAYLFKIIPKANYISFSSPLILEKIQSDCNYLIQYAITVLNYFDKTDFIAPVVTKKDTLQLVWFSQNISFDRGLEFILPLFEANNDLYELHLYGNLNDDFNKKYLSGLQNVFVHGTLPQKDLFLELCKYDVGLALEPGKDLNNNLAISNKIIAYYQSGLYILATDTLGQTEFMNKLVMHGETTSLTNLQNRLKQLVIKKEEIRLNAKKRFLESSSFKSKLEVNKLVKIWDD